MVASLRLSAIDDSPQVRVVIKRANASLARLYASLGTIQAEAPGAGG